VLLSFLPLKYSFGNLSIPTPAIEIVLAGNVADLSLSPDTQFLCVILPTPYKTHHIMPPKKKKRGGGFTTTAAAAATPMTTMTTRHFLYPSFLCLLSKQVRAQQQVLPQPVRPQAELFFMAYGAPTARVPTLPVFQLNQDFAAAMGRKSTGEANLP
jgi:hypothetical protein